MNIIRRNTVRSLVLILGITVIQNPLSAQSIWRPPDTKASLTIESIRPNFDDGEFTFPTAGVFLTYRGNRTAGDRFILEVPLASFNSEYGDSEIALGNPYIGLELGSEDSEGFIDIGLRLPLTGDDNYSAKMIGLFSDFNQRMGSFTQESVWLKAGANYRKINEQGMGTRVRFGPSVWLPTKDTNYRDTEVLMQFSLQLSQNLGKASIWGAFGGNLFVTMKGLDFEDRMFNDLGIGATLNLGSVQPGLWFCLPLDEDMQDMVNSVIGIQVAFILEP
ncbi:hypothetical protein ACFL3H_01020 [Gemmatimonadota bacterium]